MSSKRIIYLLLFLVLIALVVLSSFFFFRIDLTSDKRYSISPQSKRLMEKVAEPMEVTVYLDGELNPGFLRLKRSVSELLDELSIYSHRNLQVRFENPSLAESAAKRQQRYQELMERGMTPTAVYERDKEGQTIRKVVFPWIEIAYRDSIMPVLLLKNIQGNSGEENLNASIENLEFEVTDAIRRLTRTGVNKVAFIEGHGELSEEETYDISLALNNYFQIDRGILGDDATVLDEYKVVIIAKPTEPFSESDKYIIDQYIMNGGRVLWLLDGVRIARENLSSSGLSPAMELDVNLKDQLFRYGVRINPVLLQDVQSVNIPVNVARPGEDPHFEPIPWIYSPLLLTSYNHPITRNIVEVKADFCSGLELVGEYPDLKAYFLLATSDNTHIIHTPTSIDLSTMPKITDPNYFNVGYVPVAVLLEGQFESVFANRMLPRGMHNPLPTRKTSKETRQIVVADGDIVRNDIVGGEVVPLGFDRYMNQQFGNKDFLQNAVLYLADNEGWIDLRARTVKLSLLNKKLIAQNATFWKVINVAFPIVVLLVFGFVYQLIRRRIYNR